MTILTHEDKPRQPLCALVALTGNLYTSPDNVVTLFRLPQVSSLEKSLFVPELAGTSLPRRAADVAEFVAASAAGRDL